jgi:predicted phosphoribosyltransferase
MMTDLEEPVRNDVFFLDRRDAGRALAAALERFHGEDVLVLGLPRGGVPVAAEVARALDGELGVIVARKLGSPVSAELAIGAITADGDRVLNEDVIRDLRVSDAYIEAVSSVQRAEARRREDLFRAGRPAPRIAGRIVILVDDGLATGATMRAAVRAVRRQAPARLVVAVPVGAPQACDALRSEADDVVALGEPEYFAAVGSFYRDFRQVEDDEVRHLLDEHAAAPAH